MWPVKEFKGTLPSGFHLMEDEDFLVLFFQGKENCPFYKGS